MSNKISIPIRVAIKDRIGISIPSGYKLIDQGVLKTFKVGRARFTTQKYIDECIHKLTERTMSGGRGTK